MKTRPALLCFLALAAIASADDGVTFLRRTEAKTGVVWDVPCGGCNTSGLPVDAGQRTSLYQQWCVGEERTESLIDQQLAGSNFPSIQLKIRSLDPDSPTPRTRVDQSFRVDIEISGLLAGLGMPTSSSKLLLERHLLKPSDAGAVNPFAGKPCSTAYLSDNGKTSLAFPASALTAKDPTKARGQELFVIHTLTGAGKFPTQIASARIQVLPIASGEIRGIHDGADLGTSEIPEISLSLKDLYPNSETHLLLFKGRQVNGIEPTVVATCPIQSKVCEDRCLQVRDLADKIHSDGFHTLALVSDTIYGRELLCDPVTFRVHRAEPQSAEIADSGEP